MSLTDNALVGKILRNRLDARECYPFWNTIFHGFSAPIRDLARNDVTEKNRKDFISVFENLKYKGKERHIMKTTGWSRIGFLKEIFPDAKFIHVVRDGRAVSNSLLNISFWRGYQGPDHWRWGTLKPEYNNMWLNYDQSFVALAGLQWNIILDSVNNAKESINMSDFLEIKYEEFCDNPVEIFKEVMNFSELTWSPKFERDISSYKLKSNNFKWKSDLSLEQQNILMDVTQKYLQHYRYI